MSGSLMTMALLFGAAFLAAAAIAVCLLIRKRNLHYWISSYYFPSEMPPKSSDDAPVDIYLAVCDHYEPECYGADRSTALERVRRWQREYPKRFGRFKDVNGRPPQHTFFYPQDEYRPEYLDALKPLIEQGFGDVDIHLHHHGDTAESLEQKLVEFRDALHHRHGLLRRNDVTGRIEYGFIHGNWALCNSRPDGLLCGVDQELTVLLKTGCYADFTMPSAPSNTQTRTINSIYYAQDRPGRCKSHDTGVRARVAQPAPPGHLLMIQGPLLFDWESRKFGLIPRIENGDIHAGRAATLRRFQLWRQAAVHVAGRPDRLFVKLHTHGCKDGNIDEWLGPSMEAFHQELTVWRRRNPHVRVHYVTAWDMARRVHETESGADRGLRMQESQTVPANSPTHAGRSPSGISSAD